MSSHGSPAVIELFLFGVIAIGAALAVVVPKSITNGRNGAPRGNPASDAKFAADTQLSLDVTPTAAALQTDTPGPLDAAGLARPLPADDRDPTDDTLSPTGAVVPASLEVEVSASDQAAPPLAQQSPAIAPVTAPGRTTPRSTVQRSSSGKHSCNLLKRLRRSR